ncbi:glycosyltransferase [bacterium]|nr:glycosyltransferase [bacterium]
MLKCSVIVSLYNMTHIISIILAAFNNQSLNDFELIFADDGSSDNSQQIIEEFPFRDDIRYQFVTQEDKGFRKCKILNRAIEASNSEYLIFSDGDCIPHFRFVEDHYRNKGNKTVLCGRRVLLDDNFSKQIKTTKNLSLLNVKNIFLSHSNMKYEGLRLGNIGNLFNIFHNKPSALGSNFSVHKQDVLDVNGFDERYEGPGAGEDNDLQLRLENNGEKFKWLRNRAIQYHLYHIKQIVPEKNVELYKDNKQKQRTFTPYGIKKEKY